MYSILVNNASAYIPVNNASAYIYLQCGLVPGKKGETASQFQTCRFLCIICKMRWTSNLGYAFLVVKAACLGSKIFLGLPNFFFHYLEVSCKFCCLVPVNILMLGRCIWNKENQFPILVLFDWSDLTDLLSCGFLFWGLHLDTFLRC